jgi:DNA-binding beta-propeller fold protein YncE
MHNGEALMYKFIIATLFLFCIQVSAQDAPQFEVDPFWPKPLPEGWITGQLGGNCVDSHDHIAVVNRRNITEEEHQTSMQAPPILFFDMEGNLVNSFGHPEIVPESIHGCTFDTNNNLYVGGNDDGIVQKYSHDGALLLQIGSRGAYDTSDGNMDSKAQNSSQHQLNLPSAIAVDPDNDDIYISDGYGNRRIVVFDKEGNYLRQWGRQATIEETRAGKGGVFARVVHCIAISNEGLVYVCDRQGDRIQVFDKKGKFIRNIWIRTGTAEIPDPRGTAWWVNFSPDREQRYLYVMNGRNEMVHILDHKSGEILSSFGRPGHQIGNFTHGHTIAVDSQGNIYVAETNYGRRIQRFKPVMGN